LLTQIFQPASYLWASPTEEVEMARITEGEIADIIVGILRDRSNGRASIADLIGEIPNRVTLSPEDMAKSPTRPNERVWEQQVRNITSHKASPGNAIYEGKLVAIAGGFALPGYEKVA
jgi:hypothetical protein